MKIWWVTIDRFCQDEAQVNEETRRMLKRTGPARHLTGAVGIPCPVR